jgi:biuret amidohydrolase
LAGGFGEMLGNDVTKLQRAVQPCSNILTTSRQLSSSSSPTDILILHTRVGHRNDMSDVHDHKQRKEGAEIGSVGPMGRILLRGEPGRDIIPELYPIPGEPIIDKPGNVCFVDACTLEHPIRLSFLLNNFYRSIPIVLSLGILLCN